MKFLPQDFSLTDVLLCVSGVPDIPLGIGHDTLYKMRVRSPRFITRIHRTFSKAEEIAVDTGLETQNAQEW